MTRLWLIACVCVCVCLCRSQTLVLGCVVGGDDDRRNVAIADPSPPRLFALFVLLLSALSLYQRNHNEKLRPHPPTNLTLPTLPTHLPTLPTVPHRSGSVFGVCCEYVRELYIECAYCVFRIPPAAVAVDSRRERRVQHAVYVLCVPAWCIVYVSCQEKSSEWGRELSHADSAYCTKSAIHPLDLETCECCPQPSRAQPVCTSVQACIYVCA